MRDVTIIGAGPAGALAAIVLARRDWHVTLIEQARSLVHQHIPKGYAEFMNWGVINWGIPLEEFPDTYNKQPLCYVALGAQKNYNSLYLMGLYDTTGKYTTPVARFSVDADIQGPNSVGPGLIFALERRNAFDHPIARATADGVGRDPPQPLRL